MGVLLPAGTERTGELLERLDDRRGCDDGLWVLERFANVLANKVESVEAGGWACGAMGAREGELGKGRGMRKALQHRIEEAGVAKVTQPSTRSACALPLQRAGQAQRVTLCIDGRLIEHTRSGGRLRRHAAIIKARCELGIAGRHEFDPLLKLIPFLHLRHHLAICGAQSSIDLLLVTLHLTFLLRGCFFSAFVLLMSLIFHPHCMHHSGLTHDSHCMHRCGVRHRSCLS